MTSLLLNTNLNSLENKVSEQIFKNNLSSLQELVSGKDLNLVNIDRMFLTNQSLDNIDKVLESLINGDSDNIKYTKTENFLKKYSKITSQS